MRFATVFALAAATLVAANEDLLTTTLTSTSTNYVTVTECAPDVPDCPHRAPTTTPAIPSPPPVVLPPPVNTTTTATPSIVYPPPVETPTSKTPVPVETTTAELPSPPPVETSTKIVVGTTTRPVESQPTAGATGLVLQSSFLVAAVAAAMAVVY